MKRRVLVVEDDLSLTRVLRDNLKFEGFEVQCVGTGSAAVKITSEWHPDLVLLDVALPDSNGFELCGRLRQRGRAVIFLTARGQKTDKLLGLNLGADDYVTKPFDLEELVARVHAVLRRSGAGAEGLTLGAVAINFKLQQATRGGRVIHLTHREFDLLRYLAERRDRVVYRDELLREVWGYSDTPITRSVDHAVARLRRKIEVNPHQPKFIHTVHGDGYCLTLDERNDPAAS
jgi:DNA-binding response OmpR family regulator